MNERLLGGIPRAVARVPLSLSAKLQFAFLSIGLLLVAVAAVGLVEVREVNQSTERLVSLERKISIYRQIQHDSTLQLYSVATAMLAGDERSLDAALRQLNQFGYDIERLQFVAPDEVEIFSRISRDYEVLVAAVSNVVELIGKGQLAQGREAQAKLVAPVAERIERLTNELVNKAESEIVASTDDVRATYDRARALMIGIGVPSVVLALVLGFALSWSLIIPIRRMGARFAEIATGRFAGEVRVVNRDELGALAADLNRMSVQLERLNEQREAANRNKSAFLASMSHELRTPLNAIIGFSDVLLARMAGDVNEKQEDFLRDIQGSGKHLLALVNDLLDLSKIEAGRMELVITSFDGEAALADSMALLRERAERQSVALSLEVERGLGELRADERKFKQVMLNLLSNAVKFTPEGGRVDVRARRQADRVEIAVRDSGVGIAPEDQQRLFDEFQQVGAATAAQREGTGLGLALSKRFVELHGGAIRLDSALGRGSTFTVILPA